MLEKRDEDYGVKGKYWPEVQIKVFFPNLTEKFKDLKENSNWALTWPLWTVSKSCDKSNDQKAERVTQTLLQLESLEILTTMPIWGTAECFT